MLDNNSRSKTVKGYAESINTLFRLRGFPVPVVLYNKNNMRTRLIDALENEEVIAMLTRSCPALSEVLHMKPPDLGKLFT